MANNPQSKTAIENARHFDADKTYDPNEPCSWIGQQGRCEHKRERHWHDGPCTDSRRHEDSPNEARFVSPCRCPRFVSSTTPLFGPRGVENSSGLGKKPSASKKLRVGEAVSYDYDPLFTYYISFLDEEAQTASITSTDDPLVIRHHVPLGQLRSFN